MMDEYRIEWTPELKRWVIWHNERGYIGEVDAMSGRFRAQVVVDGTTMAVAYGTTIKGMAEQVIWYDRAMNQEGE